MGDPAIEGAQHDGPLGRRADGRRRSSATGRGRWRAAGGHSNRRADRPSSRSDPAAARCGDITTTLPPRRAPLRLPSRADRAQILPVPARALAWRAHPGQHVLLDDHPAGVARSDRGRSARLGSRPRRVPSSQNTPWPTEVGPSHSFWREDRTTAVSQSLRWTCQIRSRELGDRGHRIAARAEHPVAGVEAQPQDGGVGHLEEAARFVGGLDERADVLVEDRAQPRLAHDSSGNVVRPGREHVPLRRRTSPDRGSLDPRFSCAAGHRTDRCRGRPRSPALRRSPAGRPCAARPSRSSRDRPGRAA